MATRTTMSTPLLSASTIMGDSVRNANGDDLGKIEELMIDTDHQRVAYAVLSFGGFLGIGDKLFAIPLEAFRVDTKNHEFVLNVDREKLENAPGFDKNNWPQVTDRQWTTQVYEYYGYRPYWS